MQLRTLLSAVCLYLSIGLVQGQESRTYDGSENNPNHIDWGAVHSQMPRWSPVTYADGISAIGGNDRPNPRVVSNAVFTQEDLFDDPRNMSDYCWVWGQFIDHDITFDTTSSLNTINNPSGISNDRTPCLDLDSVFGGRPEDEPFLYHNTEEGMFLLTGDTNHNYNQRDELEKYDLLRNGAGTAIIGDPRNDENLIMSIE